MRDKKSIPGLRSARVLRRGASDCGYSSSNERPCRAQRLRDCCPSCNSSAENAFKYDLHCQERLKETWHLLRRRQVASFVTVELSLGCVVFVSVASDDDAALSMSLSRESITLLPHELRKAWPSCGSTFTTFSYRRLNLGQDGSSPSHRGWKRLVDGGLSIGRK